MADRHSSKSSPLTGFGKEKAIEQAIMDALQMKRMEMLREFIGQVEFDEKAISDVREQERG